MLPKDTSKMWTSLLNGTYAWCIWIDSLFYVRKKNSVIYARSIRCHYITFENQTALSCVQILDKLHYIYCTWHHKVAMSLLWYSSLCVMYSNIDFKTFLITQFHKHKHFWCPNILKKPAISKSSTFHLPEDGGSWFLQTIGNYLTNYTASHPKQLSSLIKYSKP